MTPVNFSGNLLKRVAFVLIECRSTDCAGLKISIPSVSKKYTKLTKSSLKLVTSVNDM